MKRVVAAFLSLALFAPTASAGDSANAPRHHEVIGPAGLAPSRAAVLKALAARRATHLAAFRAYRKAGVYAHNFIRRGPLNVWLDRDGHLCAAASMIDKDGLHDLVMQTGAADDQIRLLDVTEGPLMDWILTSGLTLEEIDRIQLPQDMDRLNGGADAGVRLAEDARLRRAYAASDAWLGRHRDAGLRTAVDRLLEHPELAQQLVDGAS